ncbi:MAG: Rieske 2Fe-2S domain-containing protein [Bradyrhizobiaceae bacterium]|nr:Rieske 2Fe-2S domain-containing protein [Bradyrhizobiaceae bacterium]
MSPENEQHSRRTFLRNATASIGLALSATTIASLVDGCEYTESNPTGPTKSFTYDVSNNPDIQVVGGVGIDLVPGLNNDQPVFISRVAQNAFVVFSAVCTHQGAIVNPPAAPGEDCICPNHHSQYSPVDGHVTKQPTSGSATDLPKFASSFDAATNILTIVG